MFGDVTVSVSSGNPVSIKVLVHLLCCDLSAFCLRA